MKRKVMLSLFVIFLAAAIIGGATMAWFTAKAEAPENTFTAGTVMIDVDQNVQYSKPMGNVNPGDCYSKCITIKNDGTKAIQLRMVDVFGEWEFDKEYLLDNWEALCFETDYTGAKPNNLEHTSAWNAFFNAVLGENPIFIAPCPDSDWAMKYVKNGDEIEGFEFYYNGDLEDGIPSGESVTLCAVISFKGDLMDNVYQGATFTTTGSFEAVQSSNNAPSEVWGDDWDVSWLGMGYRAALEEGTSGAYADYFYDNGNFKFHDCCDLIDETNGD